MVLIWLLLKISLVLMEFNHAQLIWSYNRQVTTSRVIMLLDTIKVWGSPDLQTATGRGIC